jgi:apoptosis-inducing factor 2
VPVGRRKGVGVAMGWWVPSWVVWGVKGRDYWVWTTGRLWSGRQWGREG